MNGYIYALAVVIVVLAIWWGHYFRWPAKLPPLLAYSYGVATILGGVAIWMLPAGYSNLFLLILGIAVAAGAATGFAYLWDWGQKKIMEKLAALFSKAKLYDQDQSTKPE